MHSPQDCGRRQVNLSSIGVFRMHMLWLQIASQKEVGEKAFRPEREKEHPSAMSLLHPSRNHSASHIRHSTVKETSFFSLHDCKVKSLRGTVWGCKGIKCSLTLTKSLFYNLNTSIYFWYIAAIISYLWAISDHFVEALLISRHHWFVLCDNETEGRFC